MISAELSLSMSTWWMLNFSTLNMIISGLLWGSLMPWSSLSRKTILGFSFLGIFIGGSREWMLFISLPYAFLRDFNVPPIVIPPEIVFISLVGGLMSPISWVLSWSSFCWYLYGFVFLTYFCNFPCQIKVSTWSFKCLHLSVRCPWFWWNLQYLLLSLLSTGVLIGFGHYREGSSLICIRTCLIGIIKGVKLVNLGFLSKSSFFFPCGLSTTSCLLFLILIVVCSFVSLPFRLHLLCKYCILCIHVLLGFTEHLRYYF